MSYLETYFRKQVLSGQPVKQRKFNLPVMFLEYKKCICTQAYEKCRKDMFKKNNKITCMRWKQLKSHAPGSYSKIKSCPCGVQYIITFKGYCASGPLVSEPGMVCGSCFCHLITSCVILAKLPWIQVQMEWCCVPQGVLWTSNEAALKWSSRVQHLFVIFVLIRNFHSFLIGSILVFFLIFCLT